MQRQDAAASPAAGLLAGWLACCLPCQGHQLQSHILLLFPSLANDPPPPPQTPHPRSCMFISFTGFCSNTEGAVRKACEFVGADPELLHFRTLPPGMQVRALP